MTKDDSRYGVGQGSRVRFLLVGDWSCTSGASSWPCSTERNGDCKSPYRGSIPRAASAFDVQLRVTGL